MSPANGGRVCPHNLVETEGCAAEPCKSRDPRASMGASLQPGGAPGVGAARAPDAPRNHSEFTRFLSTPADLQFGQYFVVVRFRKTELMKNSERFWE